ncbi:MAG: lytic transglycosylase domain-containing protein [Candidatus Methylacidiphilales bacterium]
MKFWNKNTVIILLVGIICFGSGLFIKGSLRYDDKQQQLIEQSLKSYSLPIPEYVNFAGQKINLKEFDVRERFDRELLTNVYWQSQTILMLKRANRFFPTMERILKEQGLPDDLKYVALIESGLLNVVSPVGASGFWQFMDKTGKQYGLTINNEVDERYHLEKATYAACKYFKESYSVFNDWGLVAASYNMGIEGLRRQLKNQSGSSYYDLYLNTETSRYVFRILAMKEIAEKPQQYGFYLAKNHLYDPIPTMELSVNYSITDLAAWAIQFKTNYKTVKLLNPWLRSNSLTLKEGESVAITLKK